MNGYKSKGLMIILDGLGDRPAAALNGCTPLEAAATPNMDELLTHGLCGLVSHIAPFVPVGTQTGASLILGLPPSQALHLTRGPIEATGVGFDLKVGDIALRANFAHLQKSGDDLHILDRRAGRIDQGTEWLAENLTNLKLGPNIEGRLLPATQHRAVLILRGPKLSAAITDTDPGPGPDRHILQSMPFDPEDEAAARTAFAVNNFSRQSYEQLNNHPLNLKRKEAGLVPANGFLLRGAGQVQQFRNILNHFGLKAALISGENTMLGLARLFGFKAVTDPRFTANSHTNFGLKVEKALALLKTEDVVFLHIKATDIAAHDLQPAQKAAILEQIDHALAPLLKEDCVIAITGDHSTDSNTGRHVGDPVPSLLCAKHSRRDDVATFHETACMRGGLGQLSATSFLMAFLDQMNVPHNYKGHYPYFI